MITDLEDSTWLWDHHPDVMEDVIAAHGRLVRQLVGGEGRVVKSTGDGVLAAFDDAAAAVRVAVEVQRETERASWRDIGKVAVRIGLNTGSCRLMSDDVLGPAPNLAARLQSVGHGGQILLAASTAAACGDRLDTDIRLRTLGPHLVRSFDEPVVIHTVCAPDLRDGFPPLRVALDRHADLPADEGELIGRLGLLREVELLVRTERLVTLWGPAGVGKSRVAIRLATTTRRPFDDGVRYVDLAGIRDGDAVVDAIVAAGGAPTLTDEAPIETVRRTLGVKRVLLVLDHCEHLLSPVSSLVADVLATCPATHVLTTSREPLGLRSERPLEVMPLPVPSATWATLDELRACPSVELFIVGATASRPGFELSAETATAIVAACRAADGLPLALELASARVGIEGAEVDSVAIVEQLVDGPLAFSLTRTLSVLEASAAAAFTRVSTFEGSFDRDQVRAIASGRSAADFDRLVRTAVVQKDPAHAGRYRMLAPFRQIGRNRVPRDEREPLSLQHAQMMLDRAIEHDRTSRGPAESEAVAALAAEFPDHRLAIETWLRCDRIALAARHATALFQFCLFQPRSEGHAWVRRIAALAGPNDAWAAETIGTAAVAAWYAGDTRQAITLGQRSVSWSQDPTSSRWALIALVDAYSFSGDVEAAVPHFVALTRSARDDEPFWQVHGLGFEAIGLALIGRVDDAMSLARRAVASAQQLGNPDCKQWAFHALARVLATSDPAGALEAFDAGMRCSAAVGSRFHIGLNLVEWVALRRRLGDHELAVRGAVDLLGLLAVSGNRTQLSQAFGEVGLLLVAAGRVEAAAIALAAREGLPAMPLGSAGTDDGRSMLESLHDELGARWSSIWVQGQALSEVELFDFCRSQLRSVSAELVASEGRPASRARPSLGATPLRADPSPIGGAHQARPTLPGPA